MYLLEEECFRYSIKSKWVLFYCSVVVLFTAHAQHERGKVIGCGVHIMFVNEKIFESYFRDRLIFLNIRSRTSR